MSNDRGGAKTGGPIIQEERENSSYKVRKEKLMKRTYKRQAVKNCLCGGGGKRDPIDAGLRIPCDGSQQRGKDPKGRPEGAIYRRANDPIKIPERKKKKMRMGKKKFDDRRTDPNVGG